MKDFTLPLTDGQTGCFSIQHGLETVAGEIKVPHTEPICWTFQGNWYRRSDAEPMTNGPDNTVITVKKFYEMRRRGLIRP